MKPEDYIRIGMVAAHIGATPDTKVLFINDIHVRQKIPAPIPAEVGDYPIPDSIEFVCAETELERWRGNGIDFWIGHSYACNELYIRIPDET